MQATDRRTPARDSRRSSDVAEPAEFNGLLAHVGGKLGELADGVMSGEVGVTPTV